MESYGKVYKALIDKGAKTVMVGHIAQPAWVKRLQPDSTRKEQLLPASLSKPLMTGLLRQKLGFNGLISTDATPMVGLTSAMPRKDAVPAVIAAGADMILFNKSLDEDYAFLLEGLKTGKVTEARLDEAVTRILATKASLHMPDKETAGTMVPCPEALAGVGSEHFKTWANETADKAVTLVKEAHKRLPQCMLYGWDIAITETGVDIVEANSKPGTRIMQVMDAVPKGKHVLPLIKKERLGKKRYAYTKEFIDRYKKYVTEE